MSFTGQEVNGNVYDDVHYRLTELKQQRDRIVNGKQIAYMTPSSVRLVIGTRVLAMFTEETKKQNHPYYPGIVGESPHIGNKYRFTYACFILIKIDQQFVSDI